MTKFSIVSTTKQKTKVFMSPLYSISSNKTKTKQKTWPSVTIVVIVVKYCDLLFCGFCSFVGTSKQTTEQCRR